MKTETIKMIKDGEEITAKVLNCLTLSNGKKYVFYQFDGSEDVMISLYIEDESNIILEKTTSEEIEKVEELLKLEREDV